MRIFFPPDFIWGTSTAAAQIETASAHNWRGVRAKDGAVFERTTDHETRREEDLTYIARLGTMYRCGVDWARLQPAPFAAFDAAVEEEYCAFFESLLARDMKIMLVVHHFTHPLWFEAAGGFTRADNTAAFLDYAEKVVAAFGKYVSVWNTFNEPNVYATNSFLLGNFPPFKKGRADLTVRVLRNMGKAHEALYAHIHARYAGAEVGISYNTVWFEGAGVVGRMVAALLHTAFNVWAARPFRLVDFWGLSFYAYIPCTPFPVTELETEGKLAALGVPHDKMWGYRPEKLGAILDAFHHRYQKPIWITENGVCSDSSEVRIAAIRDYLTVCHAALERGVPLLGYTHWSTFDNFEWNLGNSYRFGLVQVNFDTMERSFTPAAAFYETVARERGFVEER